MQLDNAIVSVDGLELKEFDYIDIGSMLPHSGAVPVVIKSLIFPAPALQRVRNRNRAALGRPRRSRDARHHSP
jgi:ethanolamine utilization protein EutA